MGVVLHSGRPHLHIQAERPVIAIVSDFSAWRGYPGAIMRTLAIVLGALVIAFSPPAFAKPGDTPPGQSVKADKSEPPGQSNKPDKSEPPGQSNGPPDQTKNEPNGKGPDGSGPPGRTTSSDGTSSEQNEAQRAVESRQALPLAKIVTIAQSQTTGRVIDAQLVRIDDVLLYRLTLLDESGRSWREYYYARTGNPVIIP